MGGQSPGVPDPDGRRRASRCRCRGEVTGIDAQWDHARSARQALGHSDATGLDVADADAGGAAQRPSLEPPERERVAFLEVLRGVEGVRRPLSAQPTDQQELGGGEREGLLVYVDDVPTTAHRAPDGSGIVDEQSGVASPGTYAVDPFPRSGSQAHLCTPLVPRLGAEQGHVDTEASEGTFPLAPRINDCAVGNAENPQPVHPPPRTIASGYPDIQVKIRGLSSSPSARVGAGRQDEREHHVAA